MSKLASIHKEQLEAASEFVKKGLGNILHDDECYYQNALISQLNMSTGENLLLTILNSLERRLQKAIYGEIPAFMFLDEVELALHDELKHELRQIRKNDYDLTSIVVEYLFTSGNEEIEELTKFFIEKLK